MPQQYRRDRAAARSRLRSAAEADRLNMRRPLSSNWANVRERLKEWSTSRSTLFTLMIVCATCGISELRTNATGFSLITPSLVAPPAFFTVPHLLQHMIDASTGKWHQCRRCLKPDSREYRILHQPTHVPCYYRTLLTLTAEQLNYLSLVDISVDISKKYTGFFEGDLFKRSLLSSHVTGLRKVGLAATHNFVKTMVFNIATNPLCATYKFICEVATDPRVGLSNADSGLYQHFAAQVAQRSPLFGPASEISLQHAQLGVLLEIDGSMFDPANRFPTFHIGDLVHRFTRGSEALIVQHRGSRVGTTGPTLEAAMCPYLFPHGTGYLETADIEFGDYCCWRMSCMFSLFTLTKIYPLVLYMLKTSHSLKEQIRSAYLEKEIFEYKRLYPNATEEEIYKELIKYSSPPSLPGTPAWYSSHLKDMLTYVEHFGMPHLFLTLTSDENSPSRWTEIDDIESILKTLNTDLTYADAPIECATLFHERLWTFFNNYILNHKDSKIPNVKNVGGLLGRIKHFYVRYEVQGRGSLHAHIVLWLHPDDVERISNEITAVIPGVQGPDSTWIQPAAPEEALLLKYVLQKQIHTCRREGCRSKAAHTCTYGFPYPPQTSRTPMYNQVTKRFDYYRPSLADRNVVPYHPDILVLWGAHMNLQLVTHESWSYYLLKYALKAEPAGKLNTSGDLGAKLDLRNIDESVLKLYFAMYQSKPTSISEIALALRQISTVHRSQKVDFVASQPPHLRMHPTSDSRNSSIYVSAMDKYEGRPLPQLQNVTFTEYFRKYKIAKTQLKTYAFIGTDAFGNFVHELPPDKHRIVRYSDYNPTTDPEGYFFNVLLQNIPFSDEKELISQGNNCSSFVYECYLRGYLRNEEDVFRHITSYTERHLYSTEKGQELYHKFMSTAIGQFLGSWEPNAQFLVQHNINNPVAASQGIHHLPQEQLGSYAEEYGEQVNNIILTPEQTMIFQDITASHGGTHVIQGVPGAGKTVLAKKIAIHLENIGKKVYMCASTGAAATRLSKRGTTVHSLFRIPTSGQVPLLQPSDPAFQKLLHADAIIIDEYSMITQQLLSMIMLRLRKIKAAADMEHPEKLILFLGDPAQLPPVCYHQPGDPDTVAACPECHITANPAWRTFKKHTLTQSLRHAGDDVFLQFLNIARTRVPSKPLIDAVLGNLVLTEEEVQNYILDDCTVLCTHREDARNYNNRLLLQKFLPANIHSLSIRTNAGGIHDLNRWLTDDKFQTLHGIAEGARVVLQSNLDLTIGAANGAMGTVTSLRFRDDEVYAIQVLLDTGNHVTIYKMQYAYMHHRGNRYFKATFPLALGYAITGHKSQGATITGKVLLHIRKAFCPGLIYVMLSRVLNRSQIRLAQPMTEESFVPVPPSFLQ